jgi:RNA-directed DNA polymerase
MPPGLSIEDRAALPAMAASLHVPIDWLEPRASNPAGFYRRETRPKKDGTRRELWVPDDCLKTIQFEILDGILRPLGFNPASHCCPGRDVITNAMQHVGHAHVVVCDLTKAFPSTRPELVLSALRRCRIPIQHASLIARLCTFRRGLPTGAPTSPALLDLVLRPVDQELTMLATKHGVRYTRYVDDLCISSNKAVGFFLTHVSYTVGLYGFHLARRKTRFGGRFKKATVTGVVLAKRASIDPLYRRRLRETVDRVAGGHLVLAPAEHRAVRARIAWIGRCHPREAASLAKRLKESVLRDVEVPADAQVH